MSEIPTISVTKDEDEFDANCHNEFEVSSIAGVQTDIDDIESNDEGEILNLVCDSNNIKGLRSPFTTDIEDYNESCSDDEASVRYPVLKVSLEEFLNHGITEERTYSNELDGTHEIKADNLLSLKEPSRFDDCPTDYENYSISSDDENFERNSICLDLSLILLENDNIEDHIEKVKESDDELSKIDNLDEGDRCISEDELIEVSGNEVEMQISCSSSEEDYNEEKYPIIGFTFASEKKNWTIKNKSKIPLNLEVSANCEESLTDIEKIDLSAAEDSSDENVIPIAVILDSTEDSNTDVEDIHLSESTKISDCIENINSQILPLPHREMVLIKEDKNGDPITNVVAMENDFLFGLVDKSHDDTLTDIEDLSSAIDDNSDVSSKDISDLSSTLENDEVLLSENVKSCLMKRNDYMGNLTDTEEIFASGLVRKKKYKSKTQNKSKLKQSSKLVIKKDKHTKLESDKLSPNIITSTLIGNTHLANANVILNESYTIVLDKCINTFNVEKEKHFIKGLQECLETHTDVEYIEEELIKEE